MSRGRSFTDRQVFEDVIGEVLTLEGATYQDVPTIYGDMSRLVVAWLANTPVDQLGRLYNELGWKGSANVRAIHEAAKMWMEKYRPEGLTKSE
jgi:hypothetical protein